MTFKEQMESQSAKRYKDHSVPDTAAFISGSHAALTSDLVKGLVEKLENLITAVEFEAIGYKMPTTIIEARAALTNYKQEVKQ
jgi:hypothetical protein